MHAGYVDGSGTGSISTYYTAGSMLSAADVVEPSWALRRGITRAADGTLTLCFSRLLSDPRARVSPSLLPGVDMEGLSGGRSHRRRRLQQAAGTGGKSLSMASLQSPSASACMHAKRSAGDALQAFAPLLALPGLAACNDNTQHLYG